MICPTCDRETAAVLELGDMGAKGRKRCAHPDCKAALPEEKPAQQHAAVQTALDPVLNEIPTNDPSPPHKPRPTNGAPPSFVQIVAQSEARLLQVRERIAELRALETEEKQLVLILTAAGKAPKEVKPS